MKPFCLIRGLCIRSCDAHVQPASACGSGATRNQSIFQVLAHCCFLSLNRRIMGRECFVFTCEGWIISSHDGNSGFSCCFFLAEDDYPHGLFWRFLGAPWCTMVLPCYICLVYNFGFCHVTCMCTLGSLCNCGAVITSLLRCLRALQHEQCLHDVSLVTDYFAIS